VIDPWKINYFDPPAPTHTAPKTPKPIPEVDRLFQVQRNALKALNRVKAIDPGKNRDLAIELDHLTKDIENTYRVIRSWLAEHT
jgi:hypothetical protein